MEPLLVLGTDLKSSELPTDGNVLFNKIFDAKIYTTGDYGVPANSEERNKIFDKIALESDAYPIPVGGSNALGTWGYIEKWSEMEKQGLLNTTKNIFG